MDINFQDFAMYDITALRTDLKSREEQVKSLQWAIDEHNKEIQRLELIIAWKEQNDSENRHNN